MNVRPGATLDSRYLLIERIGQGGQGSVWRARDRTTETDRAIKILHFADREAIERAHREAELVTNEQHPALIPCRSLFRLPAEDMLVLVFDFVASMPLSRALREDRFGRGHRLSALRHLASALAYLHAKRIVHRDLKPDNVLVTPLFLEDPAAPSGLKIIDFGIAAPRIGQDGATLSGMFGTPPYMAPELFAGHGIDAQRSPSRDVFAFGVMGWEMLHGGHPTALHPTAGMNAFRDTYEHFRRGREAWPPHEIDGRWGSVISACLQLDPGARPRDGRALLDLLEDPSRTPAPAKIIDEAPDRRPETSALPRDALRVGGATAKHVAPTEIAPASALPRSSHVDRTTPMLPEIAPVRTSDAGGEIERAAPPNAEPSGLLQRDNRQEKPAVEAFGKSAWPIVAMAILLAAAVAGGMAWALLARTGGSPLRPSPSSSPTLVPPVASSMAVASQDAAPGPSSAAATASAGATPSARVATTATQEPPVVCCDRDSTCTSGRPCKPRGQCTMDVAASRHFALRIVQVSQKPSVYEDWKNLADRGEYPKSTVCVSVAGRDSPPEKKPCLSMTSIAKAKAGAPLDGLVLFASDILEGRLTLTVENPGPKKGFARRLKKSGLKSTALCGTLRLPDENDEFSLLVHLDDPPAEAPP